MKEHTLAKALKVKDKTVTKYRKKLEDSGTEFKDLVPAQTEMTLCKSMSEERESTSV